MQKKVEQTTVQKLAEKVSVLQKQVDQLTKDKKELEAKVSRLKDTVQDVEEQLIEKRVPSSSREKKGS